jgi:hypothetical protein
MIGVGSKVSWGMGVGQGIGIVVEVHFELVTRVLGGAEVSRVGSRENPAYIIATGDGSLVMRLKSEVRPETDSLSKAVDT